MAGALVRPHPDFNMTHDTRTLIVARFFRTAPRQGFAKGNNLCEKERRCAPIRSIQKRCAAGPSAACVGGREGEQSWGGVGGAGPSDKKRKTIQYDTQHSARALLSGFRHPDTPHPAPVPFFSSGATFLV